jgi:hypothetical protein
MMEGRDSETHAAQTDRMTGERGKAFDSRTQESSPFSWSVLTLMVSAFFLLGCAVLSWLGVLLIFPGFSEEMGIVSDQISEVTRTDYASPALGALLILIAAAGVVLARRQFRVSKKIFNSPRNVEVSVYDSMPLDRQLIVNLRAQISEIQSELLRRDDGSDRKSISLSKRAMQTLENSLRQELINKLSDDFLYDRFEKYISDLSRKDNEAAIHRSIEMQDRALRRLGIQVEVLGSRANRALSFGIFFAALGLVTMYFLLFDAALPESDSEVALTAPVLHFLEIYLPRFTLVLLVEIVAFFFLRLYAKTLGELRYVQNETTNVEFRFIGFNAATESNAVDVRSDAIKNFLNTERNNIIEASQTTVEIAREKLALESEASTIKNLSELLHGKEKGWLWKSRE